MLRREALKRPQLQHRTTHVSFEWQTRALPLRCERREFGLCANCDATAAVDRKPRRLGGFCPLTSTHVHSRPLSSMLADHTRHWLFHQPQVMPKPPEPMSTREPRGPV